MRPKHELKCHPEPFELVWLRNKLHEVRVADRDFRKGDEMELREWDPATGQYTGRSVSAVIGHVSQPGTWGLPDNLCVFTLLYPHNNLDGRTA